MTRTVFLTLLWGLSAAAAAAQEPLTIADAVARALAKNPAVRAAQAGAGEADARLDQARSGYFPRVNLVESWQRGNQPVFVFGSILSQRRFTEANFAIDALNHPDPVNNFKTAIVVQQPLFDGLATSAGLRAAHIGVDMAALEQRKLVAELTLGATQAFGQALSAQAARDAAVAAGAATEEDLRRARQRRDAGLETDANVLALEVQQAQMRAQQIRAESDARIAVVALNQVMGDPLDRTYRLVPPAPETTGPLDAAALESEALTHRPERTEAAARRDLARANHDMARAALLPHVGVQAGFEFNGPTFGNRASAWVVGTEVSWNLFAGGATRARMREATFAGDRAAAELERLETAIRMEVRSAIARLEAAQAREAVGRAAVAQAIESQRIIRERYDAGMAPASELLRANQARLDAETLRISSVVDLVVSHAALERAVGRQ